MGSIMIVFANSRQYLLRKIYLFLEGVLKMKEACWNGMEILGLNWKTHCVHLDYITQLSFSGDKFTTWDR